MLINTLPYISNPIEEFEDYRYVSWEKEICPITKRDPYLELLGSRWEVDQDEAFNLLSTRTHAMMTIPMAAIAAKWVSGTRSGGVGKKSLTIAAKPEMPMMTPVNVGSRSQKMNSTSPTI